MSENWTPIYKDFIPGDVVRWTETIWHERKTKKGKPRPLGTRQVTAEVLKDEDGWIFLSVLACTVTEEKTTKELYPLKKGEALKRKRSTLEKGKPERLLWSDESVRASLLTSPQP